MSKVLKNIKKELMEEGKEYIIENVKKKAFSIAEISILILLGFVLISIGVSELLAYYFPFLNNGFSYILFGVSLLIISFIIEKRSF